LGNYPCPILNKNHLSHNDRKKVFPTSLLLPFHTTEQFLGKTVQIAREA
jgi:hypothetical protein